MCSNIFSTSYYPCLLVIHYMPFRHRKIDSNKHTRSSVSQSIWVKKKKTKENTQFILTLYQFGKMNNIFIKTVYSSLHWIINATALCTSISTTFYNRIRMYIKQRYYRAYLFESGFFELGTTDILGQIIVIIIIFYGEVVLCIVKSIVISLACTW